MKKLWLMFLSLFSPAVSPLIEELLRLMGRFPDEFTAELHRYYGIPTVCIRASSEVTNMLPELGTALCVQPGRVFLDTPYDGIIELNSKEVLAVSDGIQKWALA